MGVNQASRGGQGCSVESFLDGRERTKQVDRSPVLVLGKYETWGGEGGRDGNSTSTGGERGGDGPDCQVRGGVTGSVLFYARRLVEVKDRNPARRRDSGASISRGVQRLRSGRAFRTLYENG